MTIEEIQAVIDKGGCLISDENEIHFGKMSLNCGILYYEFAICFLSMCKTYSHSYHVSTFPWREATPEEIEQYVPAEYRPKSQKIAFYAVDPYSLRSDIIPKKQYTESDLVSFGNYLLSKEREDRIISKPERGIAECAVVIRQVSHADIENWRAK